MTANRYYTNDSLLNQLLTAAVGGPWLEITADVWKLAKKLWRGLADEGMYEVLEHDMTLELLDKQGKKAHIYKRQRVRYLQNNIIAFQDQAWGDGEILLDYHCTPGVEVDRYRPGHKTYVLISLQEVKRRGDLDEFNIEWDIRDGFIRSEEQWGSEISHRMRNFKISVIFPKTRPPKQIALVTYLGKGTYPLSQDDTVKLPDGRWRATWQTKKPKLHEQYSFKWEW